MRRTATAVMLVVMCFAPAGMVWAQSGDPLRPISGAALIPYFNITKGNRFFVEIASPVGDNGTVVGNPDMYLVFYRVTCERWDSYPVPLSVNDTALVEIDSTVTALTEGAILITGTENGVDNVPLNAPVVVRGLWVDEKSDVGRVVDPAAASVGSEDGPIWSQYDTGSVLAYAPRDDGKRAVVRLIISCPVGDDPDTLAFDMGLSPNNTYSGGLKIQGLVYDTDELLSADWIYPCNCVGLNVPPSGPIVSVPRLSQLAPIYGTMETYTELRSVDSSGEPVRHMGYVDIQYLNPKSRFAGIKKADFFGRLHPAAWEEIFPE